MNQSSWQKCSQLHELRRPPHVWLLPQRPEAAVSTGWASPLGSLIPRIDAGGRYSRCTFGFWSVSGRLADESARPLSLSFLRSKNTCANKIQKIRLHYLKIKNEHFTWISTDWAAFSEFAFAFCSASMALWSSSISRCIATRSLSVLIEKIQFHSDNIQKKKILMSTWLSVSAIDPTDHSSLQRRRYAFCEVQPIGLHDWHWRRPNPSWVWTALLPFSYSAPFVPGSSRRLHLVAQTAPPTLE